MIRSRILLLSSSAAWKEVFFHGGKAGASSKYSPYFEPKYGFLNEPTRFWVSQPTIPEIIWYDFGARRVSAGKITFQPRNVRHDLARVQIPRHFKFVGSNSEKCDADAEWTTICEKMVTKELESVDEVRGCSNLQETASPAYRCLGVQILKVKSGQNAALKNIRVWVKI